MTSASALPLSSTPARRFFRPEDLHEVFTFGFEALNVLEHARAHLPSEEYTARWSPLEEQFIDVQCVLREIAFPSPGQVLTSMEPGHYRTTFNYVAHRLREAAFAVELLSAQTFGGFSHEWLVRSAPATLGPAPWEHLLAEAHVALGLEPLSDMAAPSDAEDLELAAAFLIGLMRQALDNLGCLASRPIFLQMRTERPARAPRGIARLRAALPLVCCHLSRVWLAAGASTLHRSAQSPLPAPGARSLGARQGAGFH